MTEDREIVRGTPVVPGIAYAPVIWPAPRPEVAPGSARIDEASRDAEKVRFEEAAAVVSQRLRDRATSVSGAAAEVLQANAAMAADRGWLGAAQKLIAGGTPAEESAAEATEQFATLFTKMGGLMAERVTDLRDIRDRVVSELLGLPEPGIPVPATPSILCAQDLAPADTAGLDPELIVGLVTVLGGPTSHTAIISRQLGIPCVVAVRDLESVVSGTPVLLDGSAGELVVEPDPVEARGARGNGRAPRLPRQRGVGARGPRRGHAPG
ncbi:PEP-utilizing enzyme, partial [Rhodococcus wratislaviensis]|uniref:PEP-utilizing enzyme n=1 Tax=Rhodococcus wratislaviensis TaxID=44752 RepID=UPI00364FA803